MKSIVFLGDSITDCGRQRDNIKSLGTGYVNEIKQVLCNNSTIINKGIAGNKIADLYDRLQRDCIDLKPDIVSILIGINDAWHFVEQQYYDIEKEMTRFEKIYIDMITKIKNSGVKKIILLEPFVLPQQQQYLIWRTDLDKRIHIVRNIAKKYQCLFISLDGAMNEAGINSEYNVYCQDGVHPTQKGHKLIAEQFIRVFCNEKKN